MDGSMNWENTTGWWRVPGSGTHPDREESHVHEVAYVIGHGTNDNVLYIDVGMAVIQPQPSDGSRKRTCKFSAMVPVQLSAMLKLAPNNPAFRGRMATILKMTPPVECDTYAKLVDWVEFNFKGKQVDRGVLVAYYVEREETGRANYRERRGGQGNFRLSEEVLLRFLNDAHEDDASIESAVDGIRQHIAEECQVVSVQSVHLSEREISDSDVVHNDINITTLRQAVNDFIRNSGNDQLIEYFLT